MGGLPTSLPQVEAQGTRGMWMEQLYRDDGPEGLRSWESLEPRDLNNQFQNYILLKLNIDTKNGHI